MSTPFQFLIPPDANEKLSKSAVAPSARARTLNGLVTYMVVWVDTRQLVSAWRHDDARGYQRCDPAQMEEIFQVMTHTGNEYMPILCFAENGSMQLVDGRHRLRIFRDCEYDEVPVVVPAAQSARFETRFGIAATGGAP